MISKTWIDGGAFLSVAAVMLLETVFASIPAVAQSVSGSLLDRLKAAEGFAAELAPPGSQEYNRIKQSAIGLAAGVSTQSTRDLRVGGPSTVSDDPRYQANLNTMIKQTVTGIQARIFGGQLALATDFPATVAVYGNGMLCSGALIAPNVVITAQHCHCNGANEHVAFGLNWQMPTSVFDVVQSEPMAACGGSYSGQDIALLFLDNPAATAPAKLLASAATVPLTDVRAVGFGLTETSNFGQELTVDLPIASRLCDGNSHGQPDSVYFGCVPNSEMVAGMQNSGRDTCKGDSGGPLFASINGQYLLVATTSRAIASRNADCGDGGIYEVLDGNILKWIRSKGVSPNVSP